MSSDKLVTLIKHYLEHCDPQFQGVEDILYHAVGDYIAELMTQGNIPQQQLDELEQDLREEALHIYRKITYGFYTFREYKENRKQQKYTN